ncbi:MAG TPA: polysaccharide deacetylase family protein [Firmicutes bacterium]|jgi:peptidoglycan/xylan/chitin deacetylase (PgdA/CDA1 family)/LysM repeat protein|nr:polysaccharide deacetylase family protein [Bacillota bacterium]
MLHKRARFSLTLSFTFLLLSGLTLPALASRVYRVQPGNTVYQIAQWHGVSLESLVAHNHLTQADLILPRQVILIPPPATLADEDLYTVQRNDSLYTIAQKYKTDVGWLRQRNNLTADRIYGGQWLKVPANPAPSPSSTNGGGSSYVWNIPDLMARHPGKVFLHGDNSRKQVALTFDDGPDLEYTPQILDLLGQYGVKATFFLKGINIPGREWVVTRMVREGHLVANHSYSHPDFRKMTPEQIVAEVQKNEALLEKISGQRTALLRPPYGEMTEEGLDHLVAAGYQMINWSVDSGDWKAKQADEILTNILTQIQAGSIILMHSAGGAGQDLTPSVDALADLIITLQGLGYEIVPLTNLLPVQAYRSGS